MDSNDPFGNRMKLYENFEAGRRLIPMIPAMARLDGKSFHSFCKGLKKPYDQRMSDMMINVTTDLVQATNAVMGYTQSDEITLCWHSDDFKSQIYFDGRIQKMVSTLAALASVRFNWRLKEMIPEKAGADPIFDCRVWNVPDRTEAANSFLWREFDATKNSISMAAQTCYSHKQLQGKNGAEKQDMLHEKGVNWNDYPAFFKRGTFVQKRQVLKKFTAAELDKLPAKHEARKNPDLEIVRSEVRRLVMPPFATVVNREDVIFEGAEPLTEQDATK